MSRLVWVLPVRKPEDRFSRAVAPMVLSFSDRQVLVNSVDPDQTAPLIISSCTFWTHYSLVTSHSSNFRIITINLSGVLIFFIFLAHKNRLAAWCLWIPVNPERASHSSAFIFSQTQVKDFGGNNCSTLLKYCDLEIKNLNKEYNTIISVSSIRQDYSL